MNRRLASCLAALACLSVPAARAAPDRAGVAPATGAIEGARYCIARPVHWNGRLLLVAHGSRPMTAPLVADLNPDELAYHTLIEEGWMVAETSFRRNGMIIGDGIADLENLRQHIAATYGAPRLVLLQGASMGGAIVTLMAEQFSNHYDGAVAIDAALEVREPGQTLACNLHPRIPIVFLTNQSEFTIPYRYVAAPVRRSVRVIALRVARDGHVNVNQRERLTAIRAVLDLIHHRPLSLPPVGGLRDCFDATCPPHPGPSQVQTLPDGSFEARITDADLVYGNLEVNAQPDDFARAGIEPGDAFELTAAGRTFQAVYGHSFSSVPRGRWVAFPDADGFFVVARNLASAAATAGLKRGDTITIHRLAGKVAPGN